MHKLSIVIPVYNEEAALPALLSALQAVIARLPCRVEVLVVDDGSRDATPACLTALSVRHPELKVIELTRNFGHQAALRAGLDHADGDCVITMDGDLQHPPALIPELLQAWEAGYEVVNTRRADRGSGWFKRVSSRGFYRLFRRLSGLPLEPGMADFRLLDRRVVETLKDMDERALFLRGVLQWTGYRQTVLDYEPQARISGRSKFGLGRMLALALDGVTSFSAVPLRLATLLGFMFSAASFAYLAYAVVVWAATEQAVPGWTSVIGSVLFLGGIQLICLGIIGEYVGKIFVETKQRPTYLVRDTTGFTDDQTDYPTVRHLDLRRRPGADQTRRRPG